MTKKLLVEITDQNAAERNLQLLGVRELRYNVKGLGFDNVEEGVREIISLNAPKGAEFYHAYAAFPERSAGTGPPPIHFIQRVYYYKTPKSSH